MIGIDAMDDIDVEQIIMAVDVQGYGLIGREGAEVIAGYDLIECYVNVKQWFDDRGEKVLTLDFDSGSSARDFIV